MSQEKPLNGKVAIVTGGARGIGAATCELFVAQGARVITTDVLDRLAAGGWRDHVVFLRHDVTDESGWAGVISHVEQAFGKLDVLVNNAGVLELGALQEATSSTMERMFR